MNGFSESKKLQIDSAADFGRHLSVIALYALLLVLTSCATMRPYDPAAPTPIRDNEGILIVHVDTDVKVESLETSAGKITEVLEPGEHLSFLILREGTYRWERVNAKLWDYDVYLPLWHWRLHRDPSFTVKAGQINYPGLMLIREGYRKWMVNARTYNKSAEMFEELERTHPQLLEEMQMRYGGPDRDEFLERYQELRKSRAGKTTSNGGL